MSNEEQHDTAIPRDKSALCSAVIEEHANDNLLKIDCHDAFQHSSAIKKQISAVFPSPMTGNPEKNEPLLPGLLRVGKNPKSSYIFFAFDSAENRESALQLLVKSGKMVYRKEPWVEIPVTDRDRLLTHKGGVTANAKGVIPSDPMSNRSKKREREAKGSISVALWGGLPYFQQIQKKTTHCKTILQKIAVGKIQKQLGNSQKSIVDGFSIITSPLIHGYRNHVNFTFGCDRQQRPALGFFTGSLVDGNGTIEGVTRDEKESELIANTTNYIAILYAKAVMCAYNRVNSLTNGKIVMFDKMTSVAEKVKRGPIEDKESGELSYFWRRMQVRHSVCGNVMIDVEVDNTNVPEELLNEISGILVDECKKVEEEYKPPKAVSVLLETKPKPNEACGTMSTNVSYNGYPVDVEYGELKGRVLEFVSSKHVSSVFPKCKLVSLQWHYHSGPRECPSDISRRVIYGEVDTLTETLCGMKFQLSPRSFFQVNTKATELMLEKLVECACLNKSTTLLDLCCGTGIIGICLAKYVKLVVGIDMVSDAIDDARVNARNNNVDNAVYYAGKVEDVLNNALNKLSNEDKRDIVAIFDPPRAGMHASVLKSTRSFSSIRRIIYISCDQNALLRDCPSLMKEPTKSFKGTPFVIEQSFGVDLFPHTPHVEMVAVMNRVSPESYSTLHGDPNPE